MKQKKINPMDVNTNGNGLADKLLQTLGYESAVRACLENQWLGILNELERRSLSRSTLTMNQYH